VNQESVQASIVVEMEPQIAHQTFATVTPAKLVQVIVSANFFLKNVLVESVPLSTVLLTGTWTVLTAIFVTQLISVLLVVAMETAIFLLKIVKLESVPLFYAVTIHNAPILTIVISLIAYVPLVIRPLLVATQVVDFATT
jgi:hypothetical protein